MTKCFKNNVGSLLIVFQLFTLVIVAQTGGPYDLSHTVIAGGGGSNSAGGTYSVDGTVGQPQAGTVSTNGNFNLRGGFWAYQTLAPSAASVTVSGRVLTPDGRGLRNATVKISDPLGGYRNVTTSSLGFYTFDNVQAGQTYVMSVSSKLYRFAARSLLVNDDLAGVDFVGSE